MANGSIPRPIRVLIVDDSAFIRSSLSSFFKAEGLEVVGAAENPYAARDMILERQPDILTLDMEMPRMDGLTFLERLMTHHPMPVVVFSSFTEKGSTKALRAFELGAVEVLEKPTNGRFGPPLYKLLRVLRDRPGQGTPQVFCQNHQGDQNSTFRPSQRGSGRYWCFHGWNKRLSGNPFSIAI
jgi:chemotaxis response regulator CheB